MQLVNDPGIAPGSFYLTPIDKCYIPQYYFLSVPIAPQTYVNQSDLDPLYQKDSFIFSPVPYNLFRLIRFHPP